MHKSTRPIDDDNQCTSREQQSMMTVGFNNEPCKVGIQDLIITTHKKTQQTFKWNLGKSIVEIKLKKEIAFQKSSKLNSMFKFISRQS
jgi:hypothetical protein